MPELLLCNHQESFAVSQLMRLFYGDSIRVEEQKLSVGSDDLKGFSLVEDLPDSARSGRQVIVKTRLGSFYLQRVVAAELKKREIGRQLYAAFVYETGISYPWGALTGIRPTVIASEYLNQGMPLHEVAEILTDEWYVSDRKATLCAETAQTEQRILKTIPDDSFLMYVGIPFCPGRCSYCSFITRDAPARADLLDAYVDAIIRETELFAGKNHLPVSSLYIGGGTPTSLSAEQLDRLLEGLFKHIRFLPAAEKTIEAGRPDTINRDKLKLLKKAGLTRICINPQTFHDKSLIRIGRHHTVEDVFTAYQSAREIGFQHINMDLIAGLPGETVQDVRASVEQALKLEPESLTVHTLTLKRSAGLFDAERPDESGLPLRPDVGQMLDETHVQLTRSGYKPYYLYRQKRSAGGFENVGYARPGYESIYNVGMMSDRRSVIGIGSGSASKNACNRAVDRLTNPREIKTYLERYEELAIRKRQLFHLTEA